MRPITFLNLAPGHWVNPETGVELVRGKYRDDSGKRRWYVMVPEQTKDGRRAVRVVSDLTAARRYARLVSVPDQQQVISDAWDDAHAPAPAPAAEPQQQPQGPVLVRVDVAPYRGDFTGWTVSPVWAGVDRPTTHSWTLLDRALADRLAAAVLAGKVYRDPKVLRDVNEQSYVGATSRVMAKYAHADLKALGY